MFLEQKISSEKLEKSINIIIEFGFNYTIDDVVSNHK